MGDVRLAPTNDRRLLGVMNEFVFQAEGVWGPHDPDLFSMSMRLADVLLGPLMKHGHGTPADELAAHFSTGATVVRFPTTQRSARAAKHAAARGQVHQLKVTLKGTKPPIWRRIVVDGGQTLDHLHEVIQASFGWWNSHLHEFRIDGIDYGIPHEDDWTPVTDERRVSIDQTLAGARKINYVYDFGDNWDHTITIERTFQADDPDRPAPRPRTASTGAEPAHPKTPAVPGATPTSSPSSPIRVIPNTPTVSNGTAAPSTPTPSTPQTSLRTSDSNASPDSTDHPPRTTVLVAGVRERLEGFLSGQRMSLKELAVSFRIEASASESS